MTDLYAIVFPACRALYGLGPEHLSLALTQSARLRSAYPRAAARAIHAALRSGDADACRRAAEAALAIADGSLTVSA